MLLVQFDVLAYINRLKAEESDNTTLQHMESLYDLFMPLEVARYPNVTPCRRSPIVASRSRAMGVNATDDSPKKVNTS